MIELSANIIGAAREVHTALGPGLLESTDEECMAREMRLGELRLERQFPLPVAYEGVKLDCGDRLDVVVDRAVAFQLKAVDTLRPIHEAQLLIPTTPSLHRLGPPHHPHPDPPPSRGRGSLLGPAAIVSLPLAGFGVGDGQEAGQSVFSSTSRPVPRTGIRRVVLNCRDALRASGETIITTGRAALWCWGLGEVR
jgi:GxxExxY protein